MVTYRWPERTCVVDQVHNLSHRFPAYAGAHGVVRLRHSFGGAALIATPNRFDFVTRLGNIFRNFRAPLSDAEINKLVEDQSGTVNLEYLQGRIIDENERLYFKQLRRKLMLTWAAFGNVVLAGVIFISPSSVDSNIRIFVGITLAVSVISSLALLYVQHKGIRHSRTRIRKLTIAHRKNKEQVVDEVDGESDLLAQHKRYRAELPEVIGEYRAEAARYRRWHNFFQGIVIVGSVVTSAVTTASVSYEEARWAAVGVSAVVGLSAGFSGYFKYRERSFNLQQTADAIEREYESVELRVRQYKGLPEEAAYANFADYVETLRDEQAKRQQQLDQPVDVKQDQAPQT